MRRLQSDSWPQSIGGDEENARPFEYIREQGQISSSNGGRAVGGLRSSDGVHGEPSLLGKFGDRQIEQTSGRPELRSRQHVARFQS